jgi:formylglycine-generating enzyme required for sulfatase activity
LKEKDSIGKYRLPSEVELEYACRAGTTTRNSFGDDESKLEDYAWYVENADSETHPVGQKKPNPWGLYDMHGNVWEWCLDKWHSDYNGAPSDGSALESGSGSSRVYRGGGWYGSAGVCWSANRNGCKPDVYVAAFGFRLLREI